MALRPLRANKDSHKLKGLRQSKKRDRHSTFTRQRLCTHVYLTRSKTVQSIAIQATSKETTILSEESSSSSVICLGSFRKVPELIILDDSNSSYEEEVQKQPEAQSAKLNRAAGEIKFNKIDNPVK